MESHENPLGGRDHSADSNSKNVPPPSVEQVRRISFMDIEAGRSNQGSSLPPRGPLISSPQFQKSRLLNWRPRSEEDKAKLVQLKKDVENFLNESLTGVPTAEAYKAMSDKIDDIICYGDYGFKSFGQFLYHCHVVDLRTDGRGGFYLFHRGKAGPEFQSTPNLVERQTEKLEEFRATVYNTTLLSPDQLLSPHVWHKTEFCDGMPPKRAEHATINPLVGGNTGRNKKYSNVYRDEYTNYQGRGRGTTRTNTVRRGSNFGGVSTDLQPAKFIVSKPVAALAQPSFPNLKEQVLLTAQNDPDFGLPPSAMGRTLSSDITTEWDESEDSDIEWFRDSGRSSCALGASGRTSAASTDSVNISVEKYFKKMSLKMPSNSVSTVPAQAVAISGKEPWKQIKFPTNSFSAKLLGVDGFGFFIIQMNDVSLNKAFDDFQASLSDHYKDQEKRDSCRLSPCEIIEGKLVVVGLKNGIFIARIFDLNSENNECTVITLEDHEFHTVQLDQMFKVDKGLREHFSDNLSPKALMCSVVGFENTMMTSGIQKALEVTPVSQSPQVTVTIYDTTDYNVPLVTMDITTEDGHNDIRQLLQKFGGQFLMEAECESEDEVARQKDLFATLNEKNYFPTAT